MNLFSFKPRFSHGGWRVIIDKSKIKLPAIESFQFLKLEKKLKEPYHINKYGRVVCIVIEGWMDAKA